MRGFGQAVVLALALGAPFATQALAQPEDASVGEVTSAGVPVPDGWAYDVSNDMMSPFCPGRTLSECPSPQAQTLRMWLLVQEAAGRSRAEVEAELLERFGDVILAAPRAEGFGLAAYVIPIVAFLAGGVLVLVFLRRQTREAASQAAAVSAAPPLDPEIERAIDRELSR